MAKFIVFEGIDGSGKTTQMLNIAQNLQATGQRIVCTREPGGTKIGEKIREILLDPGNRELDEKAEALLYAAARAQHVREVIKPALAAESTVMCDRFSASTLAYQGYGRGIDLNFLRQVNRLATGDLKPDLTILFDLDPSDGLGRVHKLRQTTDRLEQEQIEFYEQVRQGYLLLAGEKNPNVTCSAQFAVVDAGKPMDEVYKEVFSIVERVL